MEAITITEATESDFSAISDVVLSSFTCAALNDHLSPEQMTAFVREVGCEEAIRRRIAECRFLIASLDDEIVGTAAVRDDQLIYLFVTPINQCSGVGAALFRAAQRAVASAGYSGLALMTIFPSSEPFFKAMGLEEADRCAVHLSEDVSADGVAMRMVLNHDLSD